MLEDFSPILEPITAERVLEVLQDVHRQQCQYDPGADPEACLSFTTTVGEWRRACDLLPWLHVAASFNRWWRIQCSEDEWKQALEPANHRKLSDVCSLLARHARLPRAQAIVLLGTPCLNGGVFLTIRSLLRDAGADARDIAPSTLLAPYAKRYPDMFLGPISWLAPGALPPVRIHNPVYSFALLGLFLGLLTVLVSSCLLRLWLTILGAVVFLGSYGMIRVASRRIGPTRVEFGQLKTFADLAAVIAKQAITRRP